jgi:2-hydroxychromene-2-carboxylate isomerase
MKVDFIIDIASPNAYFVHKMIPEFEKRTGVVFNYIPCLLGGIMKLSGNQPPFIAFAEIKNKSDYVFLEIERFVKQHKLTKYKFNSNFPQNTVQIQRGAIAAEGLGMSDLYFNCMLSAMWEDGKNLSDIEVFKDVLVKNGFEAESIINTISTQECKDKLIANTSDAVSKGAFGVPTFFIDDQIFFGKDHLHQLEEYINSQK